MAIIEKKYRIGVTHIGKSNVITNYGILNLLENIACYHSDIAGYGINQMDSTHLSWVILHWKVSVFKRASYNTIVTVKTWARNINNVFTLRDFEIYDEDNNLLCIASSKWVLINTETKSIVKITDEVSASYEPEEKSVFNESDIAKIQEPELSNTPAYMFNVLRRDIDFNEHMHNLYYLSYAYEALPINIYHQEEANKFEIMYKVSSRLGEKVSCFYTKEDSDDFIVMKGSTDGKLHAIIKLIN